ncbi:MAG TPA: NUMOD4 domain-containing protein [Puia sp.]|nr:NUMOD4 domain-containing protein [Puia sp.]
MKWHDIPGYQGKYQISEDLQIRSNECIIYQRDINGNFFSRVQPEKILIPFVNSGYFKINLNKQMKYVHRIVATVFVPNPNNYSVVNHVDGNKLNYHPSNLEWTTDQLNCQHAWKTGLTKMTDGMRQGLRVGQLLKGYKSKVRRDEATGKFMANG